MATVSLSLTYTGNIRTASTDMRREFIKDVINELKRVYAGEAPSGTSIAVLDGASFASATVTFSGVPTANDTVTIGGQAMTAKNSGAGNNEFNKGGSAGEAGDNLAAAILASTTASFKGKVYASSDGAGVVTIYAALAGTNGNAITLTKSGSNIAVTGGGTLTGGAANAALKLLY